MTMRYRLNPADDVSVLHTANAALNDERYTAEERIDFANRVLGGHEVADALAGTGLMVDPSAAPSQVAEVQTSDGIVEVPVTADVYEALLAQVRRPRKSSGLRKPRSSEPRWIELPDFMADDPPADPYAEILAQARRRNPDAEDPYEAILAAAKRPRKARAAAAAAPVQIVSPPVVEDHYGHGLPVEASVDPAEATRNKLEDLLSLISVAPDLDTGRQLADKCREILEPLTKKELSALLMSPSSSASKDFILAGIMDKVEASLTSLAYALETRAKDDLHDLFSVYVQYGPEELAARLARAKNIHKTMLRYDFRSPPDPPFLSDWSDKAKYAQREAEKQSRAIAAVIEQTRERLARIDAYLGGPRQNPEWARKLGHAAYKGTRRAAKYAAEVGTDLYHGAQVAHREYQASRPFYGRAGEMEARRRNPEGSLSIEQRLNKNLVPFYVVLQDGVEVESFSNYDDAYSFLLSALPHA